MSESVKSRFKRFGFNLFPAFRRTGGRITYISHDYKCIRLKIPLNWKTRNYVGTIFGGSMFAAVDPIFMVMFINLLGPEYIVWDKSASIQYRKPGRTTLSAEFVVDETELNTIKEELNKNEKIDKIYKVELIDNLNNVCAIVEKTLHFSKK